MPKTLIILLLLQAVYVQESISCSGYKITVGNRTYFGSNEDAWRTTPHIWFETSKKSGPYKACFTGSRFDGPNGYAPQSGMNEEGLAFERLASYHPVMPSPKNRKKITNPTLYLKEILHQCKTVDEVQAFISQYDHSFFIEDVFLYADNSGKYLVVEPYQLIPGNDASYVISNFCPSITSALDASRLKRYQNGVDFLQNKIDSTLTFCRSLSDTMHVCRNKIGDGTLLTSIWDLNNKSVNLYFYHDYSQTVSFSLMNEFAKGDHILPIDSIFPENAEFEKLRNFKIPKNYLPMGIFILAAAALFLVTALYFAISIIRTGFDTDFKPLKVGIIVLSIALFYYMYVLSGSVTVYYFPAPYIEHGNVLVSLTSYLPFVLILTTLPLGYYLYKITKDHSWGRFSLFLLAMNWIVYFALIGLFIYWKFYTIPV